uniref:Uncharacterized protein n=1 Tax=Arundo donax TaxID=35708 RepID=A0A0A9CXC5_ARUDO
MKANLFNTGMLIHNYNTDLNFSLRGNKSEYRNGFYLGFPN